MSELLKLPGGQWVDPDRVSSVENKERDLDEPCVVVRTQDGAVIVIDQSRCQKAAHEARDDIAQQINESRKKVDDKE